MKARICQTCKNGMYYGQIFDGKHGYWKQVTMLCFTEWGAKRELKKWKKINYPEEMEI